MCMRAGVHVFVNLTVRLYVSSVVIFVVSAAAVAAAAVVVAAAAAAADAAAAFPGFQLISSVS